MPSFSTLSSKKLNMTTSCADGTAQSYHTESRLQFCVYVKSDKCHSLTHQTVTVMNDLSIRDTHTLNTQIHWHSRTNTHRETLFSQTWTWSIRILYKPYQSAPLEPVIHCVRFPKRVQIISYMKTHEDPSNCSGSTDFPFKYLRRYRRMDLWAGRLEWSAEVWDNF